MSKVLCILDKETGKIDELSIDLLNGISPIKIIKIETAAQKYLQECTAFKSAPSQRIEKKYFEIFLIHLVKFNVVNVSDVNVEHLDSFQNLLLTLMKPQSVRKRLSTFKHFFNKCIHWGYINKSPFIGIRPLKFEKNQRRAWTREDFNLFVDGLDQNKKCLYEFLWFTGCRPTELINLKWSDVDYDLKEITFRCGKNSHIVRKFHIYNEVDKILHKLGQTDVYVFRLNENKLNNETLSHFTRKRLKRLGLLGLVVYGIRHSFASRMSEAGFNAFQIKELMGHSDIKTTLNYIHHDKKFLIEKLNRIN